jgi:hypothetical protein
MAAGFFLGGRWKLQHIGELQHYGSYVLFGRSPLRSLPSAGGRAFRSNLFVRTSQKGLPLQSLTQGGVCMVMGG